MENIQTASVNCPIKLVVADDHAIARLGLVALLGRHPEKFQVLDEASTGLMAVMLCQNKKPDILILDLHMQGDLSGFEVITALHQYQIPVKILVFTSDNLAELMLVKDRAVEGYLTKNTPNHRIIETIERIHREPPISIPTSSKHGYFYDDDAATYDENPNPTHLPQPLTKRELEVLMATAQGLERNEIAAKLHLTVGTVGLHLTSIYRKLGVKNKMQAVIFAQHNGLFNQSVG